MMRTGSIGWKVFCVTAGASILLYLSILANLLSPVTRSAVAAFYEGTIVHTPSGLFFLQLAFLVLNYPAMELASAVSGLDLIEGASPLNRFMIEYTIAVAFAFVWWGVVSLAIKLVARQVRAARAHQRLN
jgi:hypothetical protein